MVYPPGDVLKSSNTVAKTRGTRYRNNIETFSFIKRYDRKIYRDRITWEFEIDGSTPVKSDVISEAVRRDESRAENEYV